MSQSATLPPSDKKANAEMSEGKKAFPNRMPPQVVLEIIETNKKTMGSFVKERVSAWHALPPRRKRFLALFSFSAFLSVAISLLAMAIARRVTRK